MSVFESPLHKNPDLIDAFIRDAILKDALTHINSVMGYTGAAALDIKRTGPIEDVTPPKTMPFLRYGLVEEWLPEMTQTDTSQNVKDLKYKGILIWQGATTGGWLNGSLLQDDTVNFDTLGIEPDMFVENTSPWGLDHVSWKIQTLERLDPHRWVLSDQAFFDDAGGEPYKIYKRDRQQLWAVPAKIPVQVDIYGSSLLEARHVAWAFRDYLATRLIDVTLRSTAESSEAAGKDYFTAHFNEVGRVTPTDYVRDDKGGIQYRRSLNFIFEIDEWLYRPVPDTL